jgi:hypothetical protein
MDAWNTIRRYSIDAERLLRQAMAAAKQAVYSERAALPYDVARSLSVSSASTRWRIASLVSV